ncbi:hypothetical protein FF2_022151 [Malus domestica]
MNTTSFLDKQIMNLSQGSKQKQHQNDDFIDRMKMNTNTNNNRRKDEGGEEEHQVGGTGNGNGISKKEFQEMLPSYDFQPIRPVIGASSPSRSFDAAPNLGGGGATRAWNSGESKSNTTSPIRSYGLMDSLEPGKLILEKDRNAAIVSVIDQTMKKHTDNLLHVLESVSARLTQLESRTRNLENSVDDLKISVGNNHGNTDGTMRQLEDLEKHHLPDHGGQDLALQSHQDGNAPPPPPESSSSEPLDENLFSDLTVQFQTLPNPEGPLTQTHDDLVQNQTPTSKPTPPATTSKRKKRAAGLRIGYARDSYSSFRADDPDLDDDSLHLHLHFHQPRGPYFHSIY